MNTKNNIKLVLILVVAVVLRLWKLNSVPPHLTPDEAALGYSAYSILKTAKDEYGQFLPIIFRSFGDYKPGLYVYLTVPFVAIFGLTEFAVRLPSAISGIVTVWLIYRILNSLRNFFNIPNSKIGSLVAFFLAINPWHIHFSRGAWEANLSLTLSLFGIYFFVMALSQPKFLTFSSIFFSLTFWTYQGAKLSTLVIVFVLFIVFRKDFAKFLKESYVTVIQSTIVALILIFPIILSFSQGKTERLEIFSVLSYPRPRSYLQSFLDQGEESVGEISYYLFHSEAFNFTRGIMGRWFNHFSGRFLFFEGDWQNPLHSSPNHGMLLFSDLVFLFIGFFSLLKLKDIKFKTFSLLWLILAPLPSVLSRDQVHSVRSLNMVIPLVFTSSLGLVETTSMIKSFRNNILRLTCYFLLILFLSGSFIYFLDAYFVHLPKHNSRFWSYGYKQIVEAISPIQNQYKEIRIQQSFAQPYIYFLFYQKYDPAKYQKQAKLVESEYKGDVGYIERLDNIYFSQIDWSNDKERHASIIVGDPIRIPEKDLSDQKKFNLVREIKYLNGEIAFMVIEVK